jgi:predicted RNA-binding Zn ribbon-like protein
MALIDLIRTDQLSRLKSCAGEGCDFVFVDLSRNRSRRFCSDGGCGNRAHVAAYRKRRAEQN